MIIRMPSNPRITRAGQKSSAHIFLRDRQDIRELVQGDCRTQILLPGTSFRENYGRLPWLEERRVGD